ncbi:hypothetical protein P8452_18765 [Trifolium repens]|nr:hypothetical protein P8452_18765 [Trifolium repens]
MISWFLKKQGSQSSTGGFFSYYYDQKMSQEANVTTQGVRNAASQGVMNVASQGVNGQGDHVMGPPNQSLPTQHLNDEAGPSTQAIGPELANTQESKKRKPNANGPRQSAPCWEFFIRLPDNEVEIPTAVCLLRVALTLSGSVTFL